ACLPLLALALPRAHARRLARLAPGRRPGTSERGEPLLQLPPQALGLAREPLVLGERAPLHLASLGVRLAEDQLRLAPGLVADLGRRLLGGDEGRAQEGLELPEADEVGLELLDLVGQVGALAADVLEARRDLFEQLVHA